MQKTLKLFSAGLLAGLVVFATGCGSDAGKRPSGTLISISSQGEASQAPDIANISAGVVTEASESSAAMQANAEQMDKLMKAIKKAGIDDKDVQTSGINLMPRYDYQIPETTVMRSVIRIQKDTPTPPQYPRRWARIQKNPLS